MASYSPETAVRFFPLGDGGVLFRTGTDRLWVLNRGAACVWCLLPDYPREEDLANRLTEMFQIPWQRAREDVVASLTFFRSQGLLGNDFSILSSASDPLWKIPFQNCELRFSSATFEPSFYRLAGYDFSLCCEASGVARRISDLFGHLRTPDRRTNVEVLGVVGSDHGWDIGLGGVRCVAGALSEAVPPHLMTLIFIRACESLRHRLLFHAGVVVGKNGAVLFPGVVGSGKTTLTAALSACGFRYFSDELAVIDPVSLQVEPFPMPMSVKPGAVSALTTFYPDLAQEPIYPREDGKRVRYLLPPLSNLPDPQTRTVIKALVFPRFDSGERAELHKLSPTAALEKLVATGSSDRKLEIVDVQAMIALVENDCYELNYDSLEDALRLLRNLDFLVPFADHHEACQASAPIPPHGLVGG